jgi:KEOPS complex subunit Cgi121
MRMSEDCIVRQAIFDIRDPAEVLDSFRAIAADYKVAVIAFNADRMAGRAHVHAAIEHAARAVLNGNQISNSFEMEALLYASGCRQCQEATRFGVKPGLNHCYIAICPEEEEAAEAIGNIVLFRDDQNWEEIDEKKAELLCSLFEITTAELRAVGRERLSDLVIERVALLDVNR